jgi:hypothetical protein
VRRLRECGVNEYRLFSVSTRVVHLNEESEYEQRVYSCDAEVDAAGPSPLLSLLGEKAPGASFVTTAVAFHLNVLHFLLIPVCSSL